MRNDVLRKSQYTKIILHESETGYHFCYTTATLVLLLEKCLNFDINENVYYGRSKRHYVTIKIQNDGYIFAIGLQKDYDNPITIFEIHKYYDKFTASLELNRDFHIIKLSNIIKSFGNLLNVIIYMINSDCAIDMWEIFNIRKNVFEMSLLIPQLYTEYLETKQNTISISKNYFMSGNSCTTGYSTSNVRSSSYTTGYSFNNISNVRYSEMNVNNNTHCINTTDTRIQSSFNECDFRINNDNYITKTFDLKNIVINNNIHETQEKNTEI